MATVLKPRKPITKKRLLNSQPVTVYNIYRDIKLQDDIVKKKKTCLICKKINCRRLFEDYCTTTSLHGLKYVGDRKISLFERFFWLISFLTAVSFSFYFIFYLFEKYDKSPVIISFNPKMVKINEIPFPAVTICNVNVALKTRANYVNQHGTPCERKLLGNLCNRNSSFGVNGTVVETDESGLSWSVVREMIIGLNQKCNEMFKICKWDGKFQKCSDLINTILTDEGYCCSFNKLPVNYSLKNYDESTSNYPDTIIDWNSEDGYPQDVPANAFPYRSSGPGQNLGLTLVLDTNLDEYHCTTTSSTGFKALLSTPIESLKMADIGFLISPGQETRIAVGVDIEDATDGVAGIYYKKRQCFFARERELRFYRIYTERNCRLECEANFTLRRCGCVPYYLPKDQDTRICGQKTELCAIEAKLITERFSAERSNCNCLPSCFEINYNVFSSSAGTIMKNFNTVSPVFLQNRTMTYFAENMAVIHFYFATDKFQKRTKSELYGLPEFLSNTGGLLGLFLGFSFLSFVEVLYFFCLSKTCKFITNCVGKPRRNDKIVSVYPYVN